MPFRGRAVKVVVSALRVNRVERNVTEGVARRDCKLFSSLVAEVCFCPRVRLDAEMWLLGRSDRGVHFAIFGR